MIRRLRHIQKSPTRMHIPKPKDRIANHVQLLRSPVALLLKHPLPVSRSKLPKSGLGQRLTHQRAGLIGVKLPTKYERRWTDRSGPNRLVLFDKRSKLEPCHRVSRKRRNQRWVW